MAGQSNDLFGKINLGTGFLIYLQRFFIMHGNANIPEQFSGRAINAVQFFIAEYTCCGDHGVSPFLIFYGLGSNIGHGLLEGWVEHPDIFCWVSFLYPTS
jgi:hypothetical protein